MAVNIATWLAAAPAREKKGESACFTYSSADLRFPSDAVPVLPSSGGTDGRRRRRKGFDQKSHRVVTAPLLYRRLQPKSPDASQRKRTPISPPPPPISLCLLSLKTITYTQPARPRPNRPAKFLHMHRKAAKQPSPAPSPAPAVATNPDGPTAEQRVSLTWAWISTRLCPFFPSFFLLHHQINLV